MSGTPQSIFSPDAPEARAIAHLFIINFIICAAIFGVVVGLIVYCLRRFRWKEGDKDPEQTAGNKRIEILWTAIPFAIVICLFVLSLGAMRKSDPPLVGKPDLIVVGHQWWWEIRDPKTGIVTANEIHIPVGKPISVELDTADVLHEFWVPRLTRKETTVPLQGNHIWLQADHPGVYLGVCSEFCGTQHAWMRFQVIAQTPADFAAWQHNQEQPAPKPAGLAADGWKLFSSMTCVDCHTIRGTSANGVAGPDLTHFESRAYFGAGVAENTDDNLRAWLLNPQSLKPGVKMPSFNFTNRQVNELVAYFNTLK